MDEDFDTDLESHAADVMQCTMDSKGDHILAARFLGRFVDPSVPWVHVDLAPSEAEEAASPTFRPSSPASAYATRVHLLGDEASSMTDCRP